MLRFKDTVELIYQTEKSIEEADGEDRHTKEYVEHLKRLLKAYVIEHRKAATRENEWPIR